MKELIAAKLAVMKEVRRVEKTRQMQGAGSYKYAGVEEIIAELRPAMVKHGLCIYPMRSELVSTTSTPKQNGGNMHRNVLKVAFRLEHESGQGQEIETFGESMDSSDKCSNKAQTSALKYALLQTFLLQGAHDDPDDYRPEEEQRPARQQQQRQAAPPAASSAPVDPEKSKAKADQIIAAFAKTSSDMDLEGQGRKVTDAVKAQMTPADLERVKAEFKRQKAELAKIAAAPTTDSKHTPAHQPAGRKAR